MMTRWFGVILAMLQAALFWGTAQAAALVADISQYQIEITSDYSGTKLLLFGAIDWRGDDAARIDAWDHDIIIVIKGPAAPIEVRRKEAVAGIWLNRGKAVAEDMPSFFVLAASRPLTDILQPQEVDKFSLGINYITPRWSDQPPPGQNAAYAAAVRRRMAEGHLYTERMNAVDIIEETLFRTEVSFPANVPVGRYSAEVFLVQDGRVMARKTVPLAVDKIGLERAIYDFAHTHPAWYGLAAVLLALAAGMTAGAISRRLAR
jgi:uncharacterized protein (TIGR02186 family)